MLNNETTDHLFDTRASSASTPVSSIESTYARFLKQEGCLSFDHQKAYYSRLLEEDDDAILRWYPMYISYSSRDRALNVNESLLSKGYETYLHLQEVPKDQFGNPREDTFLGPVYNMVFVHAMKIQLKLLKRFDAYGQLMKFMSVKHSFETEATKILWVPDKQMVNFRDAATRPDPESQRIPLTYNEFIDKEGQHVKIMRGPFTGIEGEIKRIARHRIVVAILRDAKVAIGITHVPPEDLVFMNP